MHNTIATARYALWFFLIVLLGVFFSALSAPGGGVFAQILEITGPNAKQETLKFISLGMGGVLAAIAAVELNLRAVAAMKNAEAMTKNSEAMAKNHALALKGHIQERFTSAVKNLASTQPSARIASFYQFYYLAKESSDEDFKKNVLDMLCAHLRQMTDADDYRQNRERSKPTVECQSLLDVLFKNPQDLFLAMRANLQGVYIVGADMRNAKGWIDFGNADAREVYFEESELPNVTFSGADLQDACFHQAKLPGAFFGPAANGVGTNIQNTDFSRADLQESAFLSVKNGDTADFDGVQWVEKS